LNAGNQREIIIKNKKIKNKNKNKNKNSA